MIVSTAWIKEYTDLPGLSPKELAERITLSVCEVEKILPDPSDSSETLLDIDNKSLTHRPDLWGHYGMAREFGAVFQVPLKNPYSAGWRDRVRARAGSGSPPVSVRVHDGAGCLGFHGLAMDRIRIALSPDWMRRRLLACGMRPLNSIADIANYVMLETGMPLHIFDREMIRGGQIVVRRAGNRCRLTTLDGRVRSLEPQDTLVCDAEGPLSVAGVMGGLHSAVTPGTTQVFIEAANWDGVKIRQTAVRLGLRTEASLRYEKSLDSRGLETAILRTAELVMALCPEARIRGSLVTDGLLPEKAPVVIRISADRIRSTLGLDIPTADIIRILTALDFGVTADGQSLSVTVPSFRATKDVSCGADIVEEIGRIIGYGSIEPVPPAGGIEPIRPAPQKRLERKTMDFLVLRGGVFEIMTHPLVGKTLLEKAEWPDLNPGLVLANPLSCDQDRMRPSLIPSMLEKAAWNAKGRDRFRIAEIGRSYGPAFSQEKTQAAACLYHRDASPLMDLADLSETLFGFLKVDAVLARPEGPEASTWPGYHPDETLEIRCQESIAGRVFTVHPRTLKRFGIRGYVAMAIVDLTLLQGLAPAEDTRYQTPSPFPSSTFDCTVLARSRTCAADILQPLERLKSQTPEIVSCRIMDVFELSPRQKAVTLRLTFNGLDRTLSGEWIATASNQAVRHLSAAGFPLKR